MNAALVERFKQTEAGPIPNDWEVAALGDIAITSSGTTPARALAERYYRNGSVNWVKTLDLTDSDISKTDEKVTRTAIEETGLRSYPVGTVLVAMYGGFNQIGRTGLLRVPAAVNQAITAIQATPSKLCPEYLLATLNFKVDYWKTVASSSRKDPNITSHDVRAFPVALPPLIEQRAIAAGLSDFDALLAKLDALIAKKRDVKHAAMQQLLTGKQRLPGFRGAWPVSRLRECLVQAPDYGIGAAAVPYSDRLPTYLRITDISCDGTFRTDARVSVDSAASSDHYLEPGDIVFARTGASVGKSYLYEPDDGPLVFAGFLIRIRPDVRKLLPSFLSAYTTTGAYWDWVAQTSMRSGQPGINGNEYASMPIPTPTLEEQSAIADVLIAMTMEVLALEARRDKTRGLKQGVMQELLTGRIRLI